MGVKDRKEREREALREKILTTAIELIAQSGHETLTIRKLAREIEYSPRTIYLYFEDKDALLRDVVEEGFRRTLRMRNADADAAGATETPEATIALRVRAHVEAAFREPNVYRAVISVIFARDYKPGEAQRRIIETTQRELAALLGDAGRDEEHLEALSTTLFASIRAFTISLLNRERAADAEYRERMTSTFVRFLIAGLKAA
ncbi:MAG: TetR family transcriptional regulator [Spirochaetes bacterium]|jgi:AcrR family transcriptional regulator|nr:TetR family transcriptional regulator [Spirochaetota bacterium]